MTSIPEALTPSAAERAERRRRRIVAFWSVATLLCGVLWIPTRNGLFLVGALIYGATAFLLARRLRGSLSGTPADGPRSD